MNADELHYLSISALGKLYRARELSPVEVTRALLDRIEKYNRRLNAFITVLEESALAQARQAEQDFMQGVERGLLQGIPFSLKDIFDSSISAGMESISILSFDAASSTRSMALSGRKRSAMYRFESTAAATSAESFRFTL